MLEMASSTDRVSGPTSKADRPARLARMFVDHYRFVWRLTRRLGIPFDALEDAVQEVFLVAAERLDDIQGGYMATRRLLERGATDLEQLLLSAGAAEEPAAENARRTAAALGLGTSRALEACRAVRDMAVTHLRLRCGG
jgi:hypothetical protein